MNTSQIELIHNPDNRPMSVAVFLSGSGTNFIAIYEEQKRLEKAGEKNYGRIDVVFTNVPNCNGSQIAEEYGIPVVDLSSKKYFDLLNKDPNDEETRDYYDGAVITAVEAICSPDIIVLAGYRRRLGSLFLNRYKNRVINLYPGDITKDYLVKGVDASVQAIRAGEEVTKCSVFLQKENQRFGPALLQSKPISLKGYSQNDKDLMNEKIREEGEWKIFPYTVHNLIAKGTLGVDKEDNVYMDGVKLDKSGLQFGK
ncbi:MAG: phosphoribosylglycinamide formyltransferase [Thermodesulfobacteriota bacterium]